MRGPDLTVECYTVTQLCPVVLGGRGEERVGYLEDRKIYMALVFTGPLSPDKESKDCSALRHCRNCNLTSEVIRRLQTPDKGIETLSVKFATREVLKKGKINILYWLLSGRIEGSQICVMLHSIRQNNKHEMIMRMLINIEIMIMSLGKSMSMIMGMNMRRSLSRSSRVTMIVIISMSMSMRTPPLAGRPRRSDSCWTVSLCPVESLGCFLSLVRLRMIKLSGLYCKVLFCYSVL